MYRTTLLITALFLSIITPLAAQQVVAHRGCHNVEGASPNSIAALHAADSIGLAVVEIDVILTLDKHLVVAHGPRHNSRNKSVHIASTTLETLRQMPLDNGELLPTFEEFLQEVKNLPNITLFVEIKTSGNNVTHDELFTMVDNLIVKHSLIERTSYIAFSKRICDLAAQNNRLALYLGSDTSPRHIAKRNYQGINYSIHILRLNPRWISKAHELGLKVGVWTANSSKDIAWAIKHGVDYITTDNPQLATELITTYK